MKDIPTIKRVQARLGVEDDGNPQRHTFTALALTVGVNPGQYDRSSLIAAIQSQLGIEPSGEDTDEFWKEVLVHLDTQDASSRAKQEDEFYVIEIPKGKALPEQGLIYNLALKLVGSFWARIRSGMRSKGTFTTGLTSVLGGFVMIGNALGSDDVEMATSLLVGGVNAIIPGIGLMLARDSKVSDEQAGAKKLQLK